MLGLVVVSLRGALNARAEPPPPLPRDEAAAADLLAIVGDGFRIRESDHFTIAYNTSPETVSALTGRLEGTFNAIWRFCEGQGLDVTPPRARLEVLFFDRPEEFVRYCAGLGHQATSVAGMYDHQTNRSAFSNTLNHRDIQEVSRQIERARDQLKKLSANRAASRNGRRRREALRREMSALRGRRDAYVERFNRLVIQHEAAHQLLFNIGVHVPGAANPPWLAEGLACQFEVPQARAGSGLRRTNHMRLADLRDALELGPRAKRISDEAYHRALSTGRLIPLVDLVGDASLFRKYTDLNALYAQAWAFVRYLQREHRDAFTAYLRVLAKRKPGEPVDRQRELEDFQASVGPIDDDFQRAWIDHIVRLRLDRREAGR